MNSIRSSARRRGLRAAAQIAAISGFVAAGAAYGNATPAHAATLPGADAASSDDQASSVADQVADAIRVRNAGNCGCAPCWGPPAPPPWREDLLLEEGLS